MASVPKWKAGDVAMIRVPLRSQPGHGLLAEGYGDLPAVRTHSGGWAALEDVDYFWESEYTFHGGSPRPLVVIDPEDREQVERLGTLLEGPEADLATILREFVSPAPPKPEEPTGLGAVVEDAEGHKYLRAYEIGIMPWVRLLRSEINGAHVNRNDRGNHRYASLNVTRVLSEGVPAEAKS